MLLPTLSIQADTIGESSLNLRMLLVLSDSSVEV